MTTDADGVACLDGLALGAYVVTEDVPEGYVSDDAEKPVTVNAYSNCGDGGDGSLKVNDLEPTAPAATVVCTITVDP